jgi:2-alkyl-3-oxoalkanoate reductase
VKVFITGGTGFIGGHAAEALLARGHEVFALAREGSDTELLESAGATIRRGDVTDPESLKAAAAGADIVVHCAAVVGNYGSWKHYEAVGVKGTANVLNAAEANGIKRFVHLGSIAVYGMRPAGRTYTESTPFDYQPERWNNYVREKVLSEQLLWEAHGYGRVAVTSLRPSIVMGPRDRNFLPRAISLAKSPMAALVGSGTNYVPFVVIDDVTEAVLRVVETEETAGRAYNLSGRERISQREIWNLVTDALGRKPVKRKFSFGLSMWSAAMMEGMWKLTGRKREPPVTRIAVALIGQQYQIDCTRAAEEIGWKGDSSYTDALARSMEWHNAHAK